MVQTNPPNCLYFHPATDRFCKRSSKLILLINPNLKHPVFFFWMKHCCFLWSWSTNKLLSKIGIWIVWHYHRIWDHIHNVLRCKISLQWGVESNNTFKSSNSVSLTPIFFSVIFAEEIYRQFLSRSSWYVKLRWDVSDMGLVFWQIKSERTYVPY